MRIRSKDLAERISWIRSESFCIGAAYGNAIAAVLILMIAPWWTFAFLLIAGGFGFGAYRAHCMGQTSIVADIDTGKLM